MNRVLLFPVIDVFHRAVRETGNDGCNGVLQKRNELCKICNREGVVELPHEHQMLRRNLIIIHEPENCGLRDGLCPEGHQAAKQRRIPAIQGEGKVVESETALKHKDLIGRFCRQRQNGTSGGIVSPDHFPKPTVKAFIVQIRRLHQKGFNIEGVGKNLLKHRKELLYGQIGKPHDTSPFSDKKLE